MHTPEAPEREALPQIDSVRISKLSKDEQKAYLMALFDLSDIDETVAGIGYWLLGKKDGSVAIFSLSTLWLLPFPGTGGGNGAHFLTMSGALANQEGIIYIAHGGVDIGEDVEKISRFFTVEAGQIVEHELQDPLSFKTTIIIYETNKMAAWLQGESAQLEAVLGERALHHDQFVAQTDRSRTEYYHALGLLGSDRVLH